MKSWSPNHLLGWYLVGLLLGVGIGCSYATEPIIGRTGPGEQKGAVVATQTGTVVAVPSSTGDKASEANSGNLSEVGNAAAGNLTDMMLRWAQVAFAVLAMALALLILRRLFLQAVDMRRGIGGDVPQVASWPARWEPAPAGGEALRAEYDRGLDQLARWPVAVTPEWRSEERASDGDSVAPYGEDRTRFN